MKSGIPPTSFPLLVMEVDASLFGGPGFANLHFKHLSESLQMTRRGGKAR